ncbi:MAG: hypothetical protein AAF827_03840, partial [Cyanobacteria bacterium P01_D01_bin.6]
GTQSPSLPETAPLSKTPVSPPDAASVTVQDAVPPLTPDAHLEVKPESSIGVQSLAVRLIECLQRQPQPTQQRALTPAAWPRNRLPQP